MGGTVIVLVVVIGLLCLRLYAVADERDKERENNANALTSYAASVTSRDQQIAGLITTNLELSRHLEAERAKALTSKGNREHNPNVIRATNSGDVRRIFEKEVGGKPDAESV